MTTTCKRCTVCKKVRAVTRFNQAAVTKDGYHPHCKPCRSAYRASIQRRASSLLRGAKRHAESDQVEKVK
jgi:hypothetical protein